MTTGTYVFRSEWRLPATADAVYTVLADVDNYPTWWPQIRRARRIDETSGELTCRSMLPHDVVFVMRREVEDAAGRVLRASMTGDLVGTSQWTIIATEQGALAVFDEEVSVGHGLMHAAGLLFRPVLRLNHDHMMRSGERGLRAHLEASAEHH